MSQPALSPETPEALHGAHTQEIPVVPPPPPATAGLPATAPAISIPADPSPVAPGTPLVPGVDAPSGAPADGRRRWRLDARMRRLAVGIGLAVLALLLLEWGLTVGRDDLWRTTTLWSAFATVCALVVAATCLPGAGGPVPLSPRTGRRVALGALIGFVVFWAFVVLPRVATDRGFLVTAALACLVATVWAVHGRGRSAPAA